MEQAKGNEIIRRRKTMVTIMFVMVIVIFILGSIQLFRDIAKQNTSNTAKTEKVYDNSKNAGKTLDVDALVQKVQKEVQFESDLEKLDDSVANGMVKTATGTKLQIYLGNGTYADELIVMTGKSEKDARENQQHVWKHFKDMKKSFEDYLPNEAKKIDKAVIIRCGSYLIACVTSDYEKAKDVITKAIKE